MVEETEIVDAPTSEEWRAWLADNHLREKKVGLLVHKKHTGKPSLSHREAMEDAICFGWIDTTIKRLDENKYIRYFARRNDKSKWSDNTLSYAKRLLKEGKMVAEGIKRYGEGKSRPTHDQGIPDNPVVPGDLSAELKKDREAGERFKALSPSTRRMLLRWLYRAKGSETRKKRIQSIIEQSKKNKKEIIGKDL